ncbi:MAG: C39 family peptidase [Thermodesulfobacteriota bacterium]
MTGSQWFIVTLAAALFCTPAPAHSGTITVFDATSGALVVKVTSIKERRFKTTVRQQYDFSCGSAALATLLSYHYDDPTSEQDAFAAMYESGDQEKIRKEGFSLLDIKNYLRERGYQSDGFRITLDKLAELGVPAIVLIDQDGYRHFVVVKGVTRTEILIGDPSKGLRRVSRDRFEPMWNGLSFLIRDKRDVANRNFNQQGEWNLHPLPPLAAALPDSTLAKITWMMPNRWLAPRIVDF